MYVYSVPSYEFTNTRRLSESSSNWHERQAIIPMLHVMSVFGMFVVQEESWDYINDGLIQGLSDAQVRGHEWERRGNRKKKDRSGQLSLMNSWTSNPCSGWRTWIITHKIQTILSLKTICIISTYHANQPHNTVVYNHCINLRWRPTPLFSYPLTPPLTPQLDVRVAARDGICGVYPLLSPTDAKRLRSRLLTTAKNVKVCRGFGYNVDNALVLELHFDSKKTGKISIFIENLVFFRTEVKP